MRRQQQEILNIEGGGESMSIMYGTLLRQALTLNKQHVHPVYNGIFLVSVDLLFKICLKIYI